MKRNRGGVFVLALLFFVMLLPGCSDKPFSSGGKQCYSGRDGIFVDEGYYYTSPRKLLYFLDVYNGINVCLCSKIGCSHESDCEANIEGFLVCYWDGHIYYTKTDNYGCHLYRRNADGTGEQYIMQLCKEYTEAKKVVGSPSTYYIDGIIYYNSQISSVSSTDSGNLTSGEFEVLRRVDLRTNTEEEILSYPVGQAMAIKAARGDGILCLRYQFPSRDEENYEELLSKVKYELVQLDVTSGHMEVLMEKTRAEGFAIKTVIGNTVIYEIMENGHNVVRSLNLETGKDTYHYAMGYLHTVINEDYGFRLAGDSVENQQYLLIDMKTGMDMPTEFQGQTLTVKNVSSKGMILARAVRNQDGSGFKRILSYVTYESLKDGLQAEDAIDFFISYTQSANN